MKFCFFIAFLIAVTSYAAPFVTPDMMRRNGLTDEQYEYLWSQGKNPRIDPGAARQWIYRANRYSNVTNWLHTIGKTNNYAALAAKVPMLTEENNRLIITNKAVLASRDEWRKVAETWYVSATNKQARHERLLNWAKLQQEKASLQVTKAIWELIINKLTEGSE